jgi:predicted transcriptional regulator with HTH domain
MLAIRSSTKNRLKREALALRILYTSFKMFPCSSYEKNNTKCVVSDKENSSRCSKCVLRKVKCNVEGVLVGKWRSLELKTQRLVSKKEFAFAVLKERQLAVG